jgi:hypothetical protein
MGLLIGGAVFPAAFSIIWKKQTRFGAISGCISGLAAGLIAWLTTAYHYYGEITVATTGTEYATLAGNLAAIMTGLIVTVAISLVRPDDFDWEITRAINAVPITEGIRQGGNETPEDTLSSNPEKEISKTAPPSLNPSLNPSTTEPSATEAEAETALEISHNSDDSPASLRSAFKLACISSVVLTFILDFLLPMPMFFSHYIFSKGFFTAWVIISFIWVFVSSAISCFLPIWETRSFWRKLWGRIRRGEVGGK